MKSDLVELTKVSSRSRADVIVSMLKAYGIHANAPLYNLPRSPFIPIHVPSSEFEAARALITDIMEEVDPDFAPPHRPAASAQTVVTPEGGNGIRGVAAAIVSILVVLGCGHVAGLMWLSGSSDTVSAHDRLVQAALMLSPASLAGVILARYVCDFVIRRYSDMTVFIALVLFGALALIPLALSGAPFATLALQAAPSLTLIVSAYFIFWPGRSHARP